MRRVFGLAVIVALTGLLGTAQAASIVVDTASGSVGGLTMTNEGVNGSGTATILITNEPNTQSFLNNVNGLTVAPDPVAVEGPLTLLVTPTGGGTYSLALSPPNAEVIIGTTPGAQAILAFNQTAGEAPPTLPDFFNMSGHFTSLISNLEPTYDFSHLVGGNLNFAITGTTFTGTSSFAGLFSTAGTSASVVASGSFSVSAVPEPASVAMLGTGMGVVFTGLVFGRRTKRLLISE